MEIRWADGHIEAKTVTLHGRARTLDQAPAAYESATAPAQPQAEASELDLKESNASATKSAEATTGNNAPSHNDANGNVTGDSAYGLRFTLESEFFDKKGLQETIAFRVAAKLNTRDEDDPIGSKETWSQVAYKRKLGGKVEEKLGRCITNALGKIDLSLDDHVSMSIGGVPIALSTELKFLDAETMEDKKNDDTHFKLNLAQVSLIGELDLLQLPGAELESEVADAKASVRVNLKIGATEMAELVRLSKAKDYLARVAKHGEQLVETEARLANARRVERYYGDGFLKKSSTSFERRHWNAEIRELEKRSSKLKALTHEMAKLMQKASTIKKAASATLSKTMLGRFVSKAAGKALAMVFKKFIPVYNIVSTAQDLYELGNFLGSIDWENVIAKVLREKEWEPGSNWNNGHVRDRGGTGSEAQDPIVELPPASSRELHPAAKSIVNSLISTASESNVQNISDDDMSLINRVVPRDLSEDEIHRIKRRLSDNRGDRADLLQVVIAAIMQIRPNGQSESAVPPSPELPKQDLDHPSTQRGKPHNTDTHRNHDERPPPSRRGNEHAAATSRTSDPQHALRQAIRIDPTSGQAVAIRNDIDFEGIRMRILDVKRASVLTMSDETALVLVRYRIESVSGDAELPHQGADLQIAFEIHTTSATAADRPVRPQ